MDNILRLFINQNCGKASWTTKYCYEVSITDSYFSI